MFKHHNFIKLIPFEVLIDTSLSPTFLTPKKFSNFHLTIEYRSYVLLSKFNHGGNYVLLIATKSSMEYISLLKFLLRCLCISNLFFTTCLYFSCSLLYHSIYSSPVVYFNDTNPAWHISIPKTIMNCWTDQFTVFFFFFYWCCFKGKELHEHYCLLLEHQVSTMSFLYLWYWGSLPVFLTSY